MIFTKQQLTEEFYDIMSRLRNVMFDPKLRNGDPVMISVGEDFWATGTVVFSRRYDDELHVFIQADEDLSAMFPIASQGDSWAGWEAPEGNPTYLFTQSAKAMFDESKDLAKELYDYVQSKFTYHNLSEEEVRRRYKAYVLDPLMAKINKKEHPSPEDMAKEANIPDKPITLEVRIFQSVKIPRVLGSGKYDKDALLKRIEASGRTGEVLPDVCYTLDENKIKELYNVEIPDCWKYVLKSINNALTQEEPVISELELSKVFSKSHNEWEAEDPWLTFLGVLPELLEQGSVVQIITKA